MSMSLPTQTANRYRIREAASRGQGWRCRIRESAGDFGSEGERLERLRLKAEIEQWIAQQVDPVIYRQGRRIGPLAKAHFSLDCMARCLLLRCRMRGSELRAPVLRAVRDQYGAVVLHTRLARETEILEIRPANESLAQCPLEETRRQFQTEVGRLIKRHFPGSQVLKSTLSSDLEHSLSGKYVRVQLRARGVDWLAIAVGPEETQATIDGVLGNGLLWRDLLRQRGLALRDKLAILAPEGKLLVLKSRLGWIRGAGRDIQLFSIEPGCRMLRLADLADCGNLNTAVTQVETLLDFGEVHDDPRVPRLLGLAPGQIAFSRTGNTLVFRLRGLELAQLQLGNRSRLMSRCCTPAEIRTEGDWNRFAATVESTAAEQSGPTRPGNTSCRARPERWLESLLLQDIRAIDARLDPRFVYPQVPAFLGGDRGMIDLLTVTADRRLAILELKASEDIDLPLQGLDYWLRVRWHHSRNEFQDRGYFPGISLSALPPRLFFVGPQFRFHSTFPRLAAQIDPAVPLIQVGLNEDWQEGVRVVLRRFLTPAA
ncbi:MAG: hypothetical protein FJW26_00215 [Acidimicrobiia bacterium]|nr:hypothetical protein [Acidimicrobiia bacterium]